MSTNKHIDKICCAAIITAVLLTLVFRNGRELGLLEVSAVKGYESRLFDTETVHTINIVMDDWDGFIDTCTNEEYAACSVVIDQEAYKNVAVRAKGNTSLMQVAGYGNDRYSFKIEFDHYDSGKSYYGLDKLSLNNIIQDNTYMKDYLTYQMMEGFGVDAPLCSYVYITVNGEEWGLYLAVEGVEESFLERNYGSGYGELYKPDSQNLGGGKGNMLGDMNDEANDSDVSLLYSDDEYDSYQNIFENAKTEIEDEDKDRLIASLRQLNQRENVEEVVDVEEVIRYFVVHNFVCNFDSYTGSMIHNYYLYEEEGVLSMIPWDYNLAFGGFQGAKDASDLVNYPIDTPVSGKTVESRPMLAWIFADEEYTQLYHRYFAEFIEQYFDGGVFGEILSHAAELISAYVEKDPTKFCTFDEYKKGAEVLERFCLLRAESVRGQLDGTAASSADSQAENTGSRVDASDLNISDMGVMENMGGQREASGDQKEPGPGERVPEEGFPQDQMPEVSPPTQEVPLTDGGADQKKQWFLLGSSAGVLLAGLLFAGLYRKRR